MAFLEIQKVSKQFQKDGQQFAVLDQVELSMEEGELFVLLGRSGCGKTTLLRCIGGFAQWSGGMILLEGRPVESPDAGRMMVFQDFNQLFPWMTLKKNLTYAMKKVLPELSKAEREERALQFLSMAGLLEFANQYPTALSGGMKQRGAVSRALALQPKLLLMDEPFSSLDYLSRQTVRDTVRTLAKETGCTIFLVTHDIEEAVELGSRIGILDGETHRISDIFVRDEYEAQDLADLLKKKLME